MKSLITFFTGLLALFAAFFWLCGHFSDTQPTGDAQATFPVGSNPYTVYAKRLPVGDRGPRYSVTMVGKIRAGKFPPLITIEKFTEGRISTQVDHPYLRGPGVPKPQDRRFRSLPGYRYAFPLAINHCHQLVGYCESVGSGAHTQVLACAFLWQQGKMHRLATLPEYQITHAVALSDQSLIAGDATCDSHPASMDNPGHAVCWVRGKVHDLGTGWAVAVNNAGDIVGDSGTGPADYWHDSHALLWAHGYRYDLNDCIPPRSGWLLGEAAHIDDRGRITGYGTFHGQPRVFRLTPRKN